MNIKDYIESGILEQYLLGELSPIEEKEVEKLMAQHPEIRQEYFTLADTFEKLSLQTGVEPPGELKDMIMESVGGAKPSRTQSTQDNSSRPTNNLIFFAGIVAIISMLIAAGVAYMCKQSKTELSSQISNQLSQIETLNNDKLLLTARVNQLAEDLRVMGSPEYNQVNLKGLPLAPQAFAQVFWNQSNREVYLKADHLPEPAVGKQYQLWAIVNNAPVSMGVFDLPTSNQLLKMNTVANAAAFAITLEPQGGVESPTLEAMFVIGNVVSG
ncbi:MAG: anti-sigma factor [Saprospiraceae bacterium]|nr:anti-sigma factor [Saprospiraceae bacterium]